MPREADRVVEVAGKPSRAPRPDQEAAQEPRGLQADDLPGAAARKGAGACSNRADLPHARTGQESRNRLKKAYASGCADPARPGMRLRRVGKRGLSAPARARWAGACHVGGGGGFPEGISGLKAGPGSGLLPKMADGLTAGGNEAEEAEWPRDGGAVGQPSAAARSCGGQAGGRLSGTAPRCLCCPEEYLGGQARRAGGQSGPPGPTDGNRHRRGRCRGGREINAQSGRYESARKRSISAPMPLRERLSGENGVNRTQGLLDRKRAN